MLIGDHLIQRISILCLLLCSCASGYVSFLKDPDLVGDYCFSRKDGTCCPGRIDKCSVPIAGTLCYCDEFCDRRLHPDCCPDYHSTCRNDRPLEQVLAQDCLLNGEHIPNHQSTKYNCNNCKCKNGEITCEVQPCLIDEQLLKEFDSSKMFESPWSVANYSRFWGIKLDDGLLRLTGTLEPGERTRLMYPITLYYDKNQLPVNFDSRENWRGMISDIDDQGSCGASWAFSTISVAQDRLAIDSKGAEKVKLSVQNLISCNRNGHQSCLGGHVERAWNYLRMQGVTVDECYEYHSGKTGNADACKMKRNSDLYSQICHVQEFPAGRKNLYNTEPSYRIASKEGDIMHEIMTSGPVQAIMKVYQDFIMYKSGIYGKNNLALHDNYMLHSVKIIGWGVTNVRQETVKYWIVANSWGTNWGENGYFRIKRGVNECDIEEFIFAARSRTTNPLKNVYQMYPNNFIPQFK